MGRLLVGVDLVQISQIGASMSRFGAKFLERVFTDQEIRYCGSHSPAAIARYAARFAAKEATMKVLRQYDEALPFRSIEVLRSEGSPPELVLHGDASALAARAHITSFSLSMSHEHDYATAVVVAEVGALRAPSRLARRVSSQAWRRSSGHRIDRQKFGSKR